jgi:hypothetical protein
VTVNELLSSDTANDSPPNPLLAYAGPADVLFDRVQLGISMGLPMLMPANLRAFCSLLRRVGVIDRARRGDENLRGYLPVNFAVPGLAKDGQMTILGQLALREAEDGSLLIAGQSYLLPDLLRALRSQLDYPGEPATGGATNVVGPHGSHWHHLLGVELSNLGQGIDALVTAIATAAAAIAGAAPVPLLGRVWVQQCEICRDLEYPDAEAIVHNMAARPLLGAGEQLVRPIRDHIGNRLVVRWDEGHAISPERKVYAKRPDLLRTEVTLSKREAVRALLTRSRVATPPETDLAGASAMAMLAAVAEAAAPLLDGIGAAISELDDVYPRGGTEFVLGLVPLLRLAAPELHPSAAAGRPVDEEMPKEARRMLERLIQSGRCTTTTRNTPEKVLIALKALEAAGILRRLHNRPTVFGVRPEFEAVRQVLAAARRRDDLAEEYPESGEANGTEEQGEP